jgi:hypothetical protein
MEKFAQYEALGRAQALVKLGFNEAHIVAHLEAQGLTKEAVWGLIGRGIAGLGGRLASRGAAQTARGFGRMMAPARAGLAGRAGQLGAQAQRGLGSLGTRAGTGIEQAGRAFAASPAKALWGGAKNFGQGALFMGGQGVGGALGKGAFGLSTYNMMAGPGQAQAPQAYGGSIVRQPYGQ